MKLYLIRHAEAEELRTSRSGNDVDRELTARGLEQARRLGVELPRRGVELDLVLTSPLVRARQTAETMVGCWPDAVPQVRVCEALSMGGTKRDVAEAVRQAQVHSLALVGHQPDLQRLAGWIMGHSKTQLDLDKSGVACFKSETELRCGCGTLVWLITPAWLLP